MTHAEVHAQQLAQSAHAGLKTAELTTGETIRLQAQVALANAAVDIADQLRKIQTTLAEMQLRTSSDRDAK